MDELITITVEDRLGNSLQHEVPTDINISLMEMLKALQYDILATCGGMALCATCHIGIRAGNQHLNMPNDEELDMLDSLPDADEHSRLACQIRLTPKNNGLRFKILGEGENG